MFCSHCGKECPDNVKFCTECGKPIGAKNPVVNKVENAPNPTPRPPKAPKKPADPIKMTRIFKKGAVCSLISFILCLVLAISAGAYYFIAPEASYTDDPADPPASEEVAEPTYDTDKMKKDAMAPENLNKKGTAEEVAELKADMQAIQTAIGEAEAEVAIDYPTVTEENKGRYIYAVKEKMGELYQNGVIADYYDNGDSLTVELNSGIKYVYMPEIEGIDAGTSGVLKIGTYQPCVSGYSSEVSRFMDYPDEAAKEIENTFSQYVFEDKGNLDNEEVDISSLYATTGYNVVLWHGHGGFDNSLGSFMVTGISAGDNELSEYYELLLDQSFLLSNDHILVTSIFFEDHITDNAYDNTIVYLGACSSGRSDRLANAFLDKGAEAVYANSGVIHTKYNLSMIKAVTKALCSTNSGGGYNNVSEALDVAKGKEGRYDDGKYSSTEVRLFTNNNTYALDWYEGNVKADREVVLVLDASGSMSGKPMEETKKAAIKFVETVLDAKATVSVVAYGSGAETLSGFSYSKTALKRTINNMGFYGGTNTESGLKAAEELFEKSKAKKKIIILMSDGQPNEGLTGDALVEYAEDIREKGIYIYSLGFFHSLGGAGKATAQKLMAKIADSGCYHDVVSADDIEYVFDDIASEISGERRMYIRVACPVDVEITYNGETLSKENPRTSFGSISFEEEEAEEADNSFGDYDGYSYGGDYGYGYSNSYTTSNGSQDNKKEKKKDNTIKTIRLKEQEGYKMKITGTGDGTMDYTIGFMDENGEYTDLRNFEDIDINEDTEVETKPVYSETTTLTVDEDGDGEIDYIYTAEKGKDAQKEDASGLDWRIILAIVFGSVAVLAFLSFIACRKMSKKHANIVA